MSKSVKRSKRYHDDYNDEGYDSYDDRKRQASRRQEKRIKNQLRSKSFDHRQDNEYN